jgi:hypothetical protein
MKSIKEKELLVNFARSMGQTPDPEMVEQIREFHELQRKIVESVKANSAKDVNEAFGYDNKENINELVQEKTKIKRVPENYSTSLESGSRKITEGNEEQSATTGDSGQQPSTQTLADLTAKFISEAPKKNSYQQPDIPLTTSSMKAVQDKLKFLEQWLGKVSLAGPGGGAVNLKDLDDVSKYSVTNAAENQVLSFNAQSKLWIASNNLAGGSGETYTSNVITFNTSAGISVSPGQMAWNSPDGTVDIGLSYEGVVLQVGQETHYVVRNATGNTLPNGTSVYCSGVTAGSGRMEASKFVADGSISPIQYLGLCTMDISNGVNGVVTYFGYVRGLDTRGTANTAISTGTDPGGWVEGTKLYAHPTVAGKLTSVEPTLPEQSICVAVVITRNQNSGVLFVRPTQTIPTLAGDLDNSISLSTLQTVTAASTDFADFQARIAALP